MSDKIGDGLLEESVADHVSIQKVEESGIDY